MIKFVFPVLLLFLSCTGMKGDFAFRYPGDDRYKLIKNVPEFRNDEKIEWCYIFSRNYGVQNLGVIIMKKEIIWVDIENRLETIDMTNKIIYGKIENLEEGTYKILITKKDMVIAEKKFIIYSEE